MSSPPPIVLPLRKTAVCVWGGDKVGRWVLSVPSSLFVFCHMLHICTQSLSPPHANTAMSMYVYVPRTVGHGAAARHVGEGGLDGGAVGALVQLHHVEHRALRLQRLLGLWVGWVGVNVGGGVGSGRGMDRRGTNRRIKTDGRTLEA